MRVDRFALPLRIVVQDPIQGLAIGLQRGGAGKAEVVSIAKGAGSDLVFELDVVVGGSAPDGRARLIGPSVQGPPSERFVYLCVGLYAGQGDSPWSGRVKVPLGGITWDLIESLPTGGRLEGRIAGRGRNGGPALASVQILPPGWSVASR